MDNRLIVAVLVDINVFGIISNMLAYNKIKFDWRIKLKFY